MQLSVIFGGYWLAHTHTEKWRYLSYPSALAPTSIPANLSESSETLEHSEVQVLGLAWCHTVENCRYVGVIGSHITGIQQASLLAPDLLEPPVPPAEET